VRGRLLPNLSGIAGVILVCVPIAGAIMPGLFTMHPADLQDVNNRLAPPAWYRGGTSKHVFGTDQLGRDLLARVLQGGRVSLMVGAVGVVLAGGIGAILGVLSGYYRNRMEVVVMGLVDVLLATPFVLVAIVIAAILGPGLGNVLAVLGITGWVLFARVMHARTLAIGGREFIEAARALGATDPWIIRFHIIPHVVAPLTVLAALQAGRMMLAEAAISFLGLGVEVSHPSWGTMLGTSRDYIWNAPWILTFPGLAITMTVLGINLFGEWLRVRMDPQSKTF
jgi:peptide/nickel transport system permease protein